jgi:hypothetical protein
MLAPDAGPGRRAQGVAALNRRLAFGRLVSQRRLVSRRSVSGIWYFNVSHLEFRRRCVLTAVHPRHLAFGTSTSGLSTFRFDVCPHQAQVSRTRRLIWIGLLNRFSADQRNTRLLLQLARDVAVS